MEREQQKTIVQDLMQRLLSDVINRIDSGYVPEDWDGHELRQYLADKANDQFVFRKMDPARMRQYRNTVIVNNL